MSIVCFRRIAGGLLLFGVLYLFLHPLWGTESAVAQHASRFPFMTPERTLLSSLMLMVWVLTLIMDGVVLLCGKAYPWWFATAGLLAYVFFCTTALGGVYFFMDKIHSEQSFWVAYTMNIVPIVQFMAMLVLGPHHDLERSAPVPRKT